MSKAPLVSNLYSVTRYEDPRYQDKFLFDAFQNGAEAQRNDDHTYYSEVVRKRDVLIEKLFETLSHADFSSGVEFFGVDEGRELTSRHIEQLCEEWEALKEEK